jgi:cell surface protein SprA
VLTEIARVFLMGIVLFYAAINLGFLSSYQSQVNQTIWIDIFYKTLERQELSEQQKPFEQKKSDDIQGIAVQNTDAGVKQLTIPLDIPADSTNSGNVPQVNANLQQDTSSAKDSSLAKKVLSPQTTQLNVPLKTFSDTTKNKNSVSRINFALQKDTTRFKDTSAAKKDTIKIDSMAIDSTARLKYLKYNREDVPNVQLSLQDQSGFYAKPSETVATRVIAIDSTGEYVEIKDVVGTEDRKILLRMPVEDYINLQLALNETNIWGSTFNGLYAYKGSKRELGELFKDITSFEIPLPSIGVLSIFGKPVIKLQIGGAVDIHAAWDNTSTQGVTTSALGNTQNTPNFQQQVQINVNGTIGDKLNISADWNTQRTFDYQNQLKIKYTGYEDEIVQSIEAGNVAMQASPLVGGSDALFGIKAQFKLGPLALTTLASQQKGQMKTVSVNNGTQSSTFALRAYNYATNNFFVDTIFASQTAAHNIFYNYYGAAVPQVDYTNKIIQIQVWKSQNTVLVNLAKERSVNAWLNLPNVAVNSTYPATLDSLRSSNFTAVPGTNATGLFVLLTEGTDYIMNYQTGFITFLTTVNDADAIAVAYTYNGGTQQYGEMINTAAVDTSTRVILKLVKAPYLIPQYAQAWKLMLKNIYSIQASNIQQNGFTVQIKYEIPGQTAVTTYPEGNAQIQLLNAFGWDNYDASGNPNPDNIFDWRPGITIIPAAGEIIFPRLEPFSSQSLVQKGLTDTSLTFQSVYDTTSTFAAQDQVHDKWSINGTYTGNATSIYQLGFNLVENSVKLTLNGKQLTASQDYTVDYNTGQLTIMNNNALIPGAALSITYEQNDLFTLASKTMLGARGMVNISDKTKLGFSILNLNEQSLNDKVRIGEEPLSNTMMGVDFNTASDLPFLTDALDKVISTKQMSSFTFAGEFAHMAPNPNTIKSTITDDGGQSVAYIDDFEGSEKLIPIGVGYSVWKDLSAPDSLAKLSGYNTSQYMDDPTKNYYQNLMRYKAKSWWFSVTPSNVKVSDIYGNTKQVSSTDQQESVMDYCFLPDTPGYDNMNPKNMNPNQTGVDVKKNWGGMMKVLSTTANNLQAQNMQYIQFWMWVDPSTPKGAMLYIDLGQISEDTFGDHILHTEDINHNGILAPGSDVGIDGMTDAQEIDSATNAGYYTKNKADPDNDDFDLSSPNPSDIYSYFNVDGTEGNGVNTDIGRIPDTEDLNLNGNLDVVNSYYRYNVPLDTSAAQNLNLIDGLPNTTLGWHLYRIPLQKYTDSIGSPTLSNVGTIRVFTTGSSQLVHIRFAEFNLTGNTWQQVIPYDTIMSLGVINLEDNPNYYSPPGLQRELDRTVTTATVYLNEQSQDLIVSGLQPGVNRQVVDYLPRPLDVFNYSEMKIFFHGDITPGTNIAGTTGGKSNAEAILRFGTDTNNYYEYRQPVLKDWNDADIIFKDLTAIKEAQTSTNDTTIHTVLISGYTDRYYAIKGNPSLTSLSYFTIEILNNTNNTTLRGEVWVDELRVVGADNHSGNAYTLATSIKLADLISVSFNMSHTDPYFHSLTNQFGSRNDTKNWSLSGNVNMLKLLPFNLATGSNFSLNYSHTESVEMPLYLPGTDVAIAAVVANANSDTSKNTTHQTAAQITSSAQIINTSDSWSLGTIALKIPTSLWYIRDTFNSLSFMFNYNKTFGRNPTVLSTTSWLWNAGINYSVSSSPDNYFMPVKIPFFGSVLGFLTDYRSLKIYYAPQSFAFNVSAQRNRSFTTSRPTPSSSDTTSTEGTSIFSHDFTTGRGFNFSWKITDGGFINLATDYSATINSSLAYLETDTSNNLVSEREVWREIFSGALFGRDFSFQQNVDFRVSPKLPSIWDIDKNFNISASYSVGYQWAHNFSEITQDSAGKNIDAGKSAGFQNRSQVSLKISLKALMDPLFGSGDENSSLSNGPNGTNIRGNNPQGNNAPGRIPPGGNSQGGNQPGNNPEGRQRNFGQETVKKDSIEVNKDAQKVADGNKNKNFVADTTAKLDSLSQSKMANKFSIKNAVLLLRTIAKTIFFDYETININFSNSNTISKAALSADGGGFGNFWGFTLNQSEGPSRLFMLGLSSDVGDRVAGLGTITDVFSQSNNIDLETSRPLWEGAKIDLSWKLSWSLNQSTPYTTATPNGSLASAGPITSTGTLSRSFLSLPPVSLLSVFKSGVSQVNKLYNPNAIDPQQSLSQAFIEGFETLPLLSQTSFLQNVADYIPRPNWTITWDGLEKYWPFKSIAEKVSLDHSYNSSYTEGWYIDPNGNKVTQQQQINYAFAPLIGLNMTFGKLWNGSLSGSIKYATSSTFILGLSSLNMTQTASRDIGVSATYSKSGFEFPLFGISLKNDVDFTFSYTYSENSTVLFDMTNFTDGGTLQDGQTRITIEPRVKYTISSKVSLSIFYTRTTVQPAASSTLLPTTDNQAGLDVHIAIGG